MNASHGSWVKGLVGHMGHESLSLTHLQLCLQVCQIRRNRISQNNGLYKFALVRLLLCVILFYTLAHLWMQSCILCMHVSSNVFILLYHRFSKGGYW